MKMMSEYNKKESDIRIVRLIFKHFMFDGLHYLDQKELVELLLQILKDEYGE